MKISFTLLFLVLSITFLHGQSNKFVHGKLITNAGDTLTGYIKLQEFSVDKGFVNNKIHFKEDLEKEQTSFKKKEIESILVNDKFYRKINYHIYDYESNENIKVSQLMELITEGPLSLYSYEEITSSSSAGSHYITKFYLGYENSEIFENIKKSNFKKVIKKYIKDCNILQEKNSNKTYKFKDLDIIINKYNNNCL